MFVRLCFPSLLLLCSNNFKLWWRHSAQQNHTIFVVWSQTLWIDLKNLRMSASCTNCVAGSVDLEFVYCHMSNILVLQSSVILLIRYDFWFFKEVALCYLILVSCICYYIVECVAAQLTLFHACFFVYFTCLIFFHCSSWFAYYSLILFWNDIG